jgi:DNA polymerase-3 subunit delta'
LNIDLVRKNAAYLRFSEDVKKNAVSHAYIVYGADEEARRAFFTLACMSLLCEKKTACGECGTCRDILEGRYVEITYLDGGALSIGKGEIKAEGTDGNPLDFIAVRPLVGDRKIFIIDNADKTSAAVQNKLLKIYEEPPLYLTFFLGANNENGLLPTIRSRGKKLFMSDTDAADIEKELISEGEDEDTARSAAAFSLGNYGKALKMCTDGKYRKVYDDVFGMFLNMKKSSQTVEYVYKDIFSKENILTAFDFMEIILCDVMKKVSKSGAPLFTTGRERDLCEVAEGFSAQGACMAISAVNEGRKLLNANVSPVSAAGRVLFGILEAKYKWQA